MKNSKILLVCLDYLTQPEEAVEALAKAVYDLGEAVGITMNFKGYGVDEKFGKTAPMKLPCLLMKINVHLLTLASYQW